MITTRRTCYFSKNFVRNPNNKKELLLRRLKMRSHSSKEPNQGNILLLLFPSHFPANFGARDSFLSLLFQVFMHALPNEEGVRGQKMRFYHHPGLAKSGWSITDAVVGQQLRDASSSYISHEERVEFGREHRPPEFGRTSWLITYLHTYYITESAWLVLG